MSPWSPWSILPRMKVKEYLRDYHPLRCIRYRKRLNRYIHASQDSEGNFCFVSVNINKVSRYLKLLVKLPAKKKKNPPKNQWSPNLFFASLTKQFCGNQLLKTKCISKMWASDWHWIPHICCGRHCWLSFVMFWSMVLESIATTCNQWNVHHLLA